MNPDDITLSSQGDFQDDYNAVFETPKGLNEQIVREISAIKKEPEWMLEYRLKSLKCFLEKPMPEWGLNLKDMDFNDYTYYSRPS